jgi:hypothetical protein
MSNISILRERENSYIGNAKLAIKREYLEDISKTLMGTGLLSGISDLEHFLKEEGNPIIIKLGDFLSFSDDFIRRGEYALGLEVAKESSVALREEYNNCVNRFIDVRGQVDEKNPNLSSNRDKFCENKLYDCLEINSMDDYETLFSIIENLLNVKKKVYKRRDLLLMKDSIGTSLSYIFSDDQMLLYENRCSELFESEDINLTVAEDFLKSMQSVIIDNWKNEITNVDDFVPGKPFKFICHSTSTSKFEGDFHSRYVSTSLLNEEFTQTYNSGFGFILSTDNIVGASSEDMYVHNSSSNSEDITNGSSLPKIYPPSQIIDNCRKQIVDNKEQDKKIKVYSEIVVDGFSPQAIFCITNGSKMLDNNYSSALKLAEQFPHLKVIEIDLTLYKERSELIDCRNSLIKSIEIQINSEYYKNPEINCDLYELFWRKYLELKKDNTYKEPDIIDLYRENKEILSIGLSAERLFSDKYDEDTIKYALLKNRKFGIDNILSGKFGYWDIRGLQRELEGYFSNEILNRLYPDIGLFLRLFNEVNITDETLVMLKGSIPITFSSMIETMYKILQHQKDEIIDERDKIIGEKESIELTISKHKKEYDRNNRYGEIIDSKYYYAIAQITYSNEINKRDETILEEESLSQSKDVVELELSTKEKMKDSYSKHRILNYFKLKKINVEISSLKSRVSGLSNALSTLGDNKAVFQKELSNLDHEFQSKVGCTFSEYPLLLEEATINYDCSFKVSCEYEISQLKKELEKIEARLYQLSQDEKHLDENINLATSNKRVA